MANPLYKVSFTSNFRFGKLREKIDEIVGDSNKGIVDSIARNTKKNILTASYESNKLSDVTLDARRRGASSFSGHNPSPTTETRPLLYSKRLFDSIKPTKDGLEIMDYAFEHQKGFTTSSGKSVPPRPFIATIDEDKDALKKINDRIVNRINKTMLKTSR